jgi:hypothetical protein
VQRLLKVLVVEIEARLVGSLVNERPEEEILVRDNNKNNINGKGVKYMRKVLALQSLKAEKNIELRAASSQSTRCGDRSAASWFAC